MVVCVPSISERQESPNKDTKDATNRNLHPSRQRRKQIASKRELSIHSWRRARDMSEEREAQRTSATVQRRKDSHPLLSFEHSPRILPDARLLLFVRIPSTMGTLVTSSRDYSLMLVHLGNSRWCNRLGHFWIARPRRRGKVPAKVRQDSPSARGSRRA